MNRNNSLGSRCYFFLKFIISKAKRLRVNIGEYRSAPTSPIASAVATNVNAVVITSSPRPICFSKALNAICKASVPDARPTALSVPQYSAISFSKAVTFFPQV